MKIESVLERSFAPYGQVVQGMDTSPLVEALQTQTPLPEGTDYRASEPALESLPIARWVRDNLFGGMPAQLGWCNGHNTKLNCLEYHRDSEFNLGTEEFILLIAKQEEMEEGKLDTAKVRAFRCPPGVLVEVYATTLHFAPCHTDPLKGFRVMVALPLGTNTEKPAIAVQNTEDARLWARNKWLLAHPQSPEAGQGAWIGLVGENIDIVDLLNCNSTQER